MMPAPPRLGFGLMCKAPRPGLAKTRLAPSIGADAAASLARAMLSDCAETVSSAAASLPLELVGFYRPRDAGHDLRAIFGRRWDLRFADAGDLGATMSLALRALVSRNPDGALIMGADVPLMSAADVLAAGHRLHEAPAKSVVIVPSLDGGYCLIGVKDAHAAAPLFAPMPWGTHQVLRETLRRAEATGLHVELLPPQRDVDEPHDLAWLRTELALHPARARHTRDALARLDAQGDVVRAPCLEP